MLGYIYKTTNIINNKIYIGQHKYNGNSIDPKYLGSGKLLLEAVKKYGKENFNCEILKWCETEEELNEAEIYYIALYKSKVTDNNYNMSDGGFVPRLSGELNGNYGIHRPHTDAEKQHQSELMKGHKPTFTRKHTEEECKKMSANGKQREHNLNVKDYDHISKMYTGSKMMTNGIEQHWVYADELENMLAQGWWIGSCKKRKPKTVTNKSIEGHKRSGEKLRNSVWVHKGTDKKQITIDELEYYYSLGYSKGMKDKAKD